MRFLKNIALVSLMLTFWALPAHLEQNAVLTTVQASNVLSNTATITWQSIVSGSSWVDYGLTNEYGKTLGDAAMSTSHTVTLIGLENNRAYHYRVRSVDALGNTMSSPDLTLQTTQGVMDSTAPSTINDLRVVEQSFTSVTLEWTATGDDGLTGTSTRYDIRRSANDSLLREETWFAQTAVTGAPQPLLSGIKQRFVLSNLEAGTMFFVAIRPVDEAGNVAGVSEVVKVLTEPASFGAFQIRRTRIVNRTSEAIFLQWQTTVPATTEPLFGKTTTYEMPIPANSRKTYDHAMIVGGLQPGVTYHIKLQGMDQLGNTSSTGDLQVSTLK